MILTGKYQTAHVHLFLLLFLTLTRDIHLQNKLRKRTNYGEKSLPSSGLKKGMGKHIF